MQLLYGRTAFCVHGKEPRHGNLSSLAIDKVLGLQLLSPQRDVDGIGSVKGAML
jgi:hypothetical protein